MRALLLALALLLTGCAPAMQIDGPALVSFVDAGPASRSQLPVLKSMREQYGSRITIMVVSDQPNLSHDWNLGDIRVVATDSGLAARFAVARLPTTVLVGAGGEVLDRVEGLATSPRLSFPLQKLLSTPQGAS